MSDASVPKVLCACTGNICRSPAMELFLAKAWGDDAEVTSAGTYAMEGWEVPDAMQRVIAAEGLDARAHEPVQLDLAAVTDADLVLFAASDHRAWVDQRLGGLLPSAFLLTEAAALTVFAQKPAGETRADRIRGAASALNAARVQLGDVHQTNVLDPYGLSASAHAQAMKQIVDASNTLITWLA